MAQRVNIIMTSDLSEGEGASTVAFGFEGTDYEIDLTEKESEQFRKAVSKYVGAARVVKAKRKRANAKGGDGPSAREIREWARENTDYEVPERGRIPEDVREAYRAAHN